MTQFTQSDALNYIFNGSYLTKKMNVYKHRYINGVLSQKSIDLILEANGFTVIQEKLYIRK